MAHDARQIANLAHDFLRAALRCHERLPIPGKPNDMQRLSVPGVVCSAFAAELALKAILTVEGRPATGHDLAELFNAVSPPVQRQIFPLMPKLREDQFKSNLRQCAHAFEEWRYIYESAGGYVDYEFVYLAANAFFVIAMTLIDRPGGRAPRNP